jgi:imidazolonepropionase-like amidohydrolase
LITPKLIPCCALLTLAASFAETVVFEHVSVVPMDRERVIVDYNVVVEGERIVAAGPARVVGIPKNARQINGQNKYLVPGLADMHVHLGGLPNHENNLTLFVANGITTVRSMWGLPEVLDWKKQIKRGTLLGPTIVTAGPLTDGRPPVWPGSRVVESDSEAESAAKADREAGYDAMKVYNRLTPSAYEALVSSAHKLGLPVYGHVPTAVGLLNALRLRQDSIEHTTGYIAAMQSDASPYAKKPGSETLMVEYVDMTKLPALAEATRSAGTWNCPTIVVLKRTFVSPERLAVQRSEPEMKYISAATMRFWDPKEDFRIKDMKADDFERRRRQSETAVEITRALHKGGARILLGTDTPNPWVVPGLSVHDELENLVAAGLSPFEALRAGTSGAAEFLQQSKEFGTIAAGRRADLILTDGNPLADVRALRRRVGVMLRGRWMPASELQGMLDRIAATYAAKRDTGK